ncbi:MAG: hypothetical protein ACFCVF_07935 [Kineosporiaceae bacterium]
MRTEPVTPAVSSDGSLVVPVEPPPARRAVPARDHSGPLTGERVVVLQAHAYVYDLRAVSEVYTDDRGRPVVDVAAEADYYRAAGRHRSARMIHADLVFVERPPDPGPS